MKVLMFYKFSAIETELIPMLEKYKKHTITLVVNGKTIKGYKRKLKDYSINYYTMDKFINGEKMEKFDYIVGNPPYQYPEGVNTSKKLYIDITKRCINLLNPTGEMSFITPKGILMDGRFNTTYKFISENLTMVDYTTNNDFVIGQSVVSWNVTREYKIYYGD